MTLDAQHKAAPGPDIESMFLFGGGHLSRGLERAQLARGARVYAGRLAAFLVAVTWSPVLILAMFQGVALGGKGVVVPFLKDFLPQGQFLLVVPTLVFGEVIVGRLLGLAAAELRRSDVLAPEATPALENLLARAVERWQGRTVDIVLLLFTLVATGLWFWGAREWLAGGWQYVDKRITAAGWWYLLVSLPVMRFLMLRWLWRMLLWAWVLLRVSKLKLNPCPMHPDRAGGLAFLGSTQAAFGILVFAFGVQLSCLIADEVCYQGVNLMTFKWEVVAFVIIAVGVSLLPLLVFAPKLVRARVDGLLFLSGTGYHGADLLWQKLHLNRSKDLPAENISGLSDFGALYENARLMKPVPLEWRHVLVLVLAAIIPFAPLVFLVMPAREVFQTLGELLV